MNQSENIDTIAPALVAAIGELKNVGREKEGQIGNARYKYADLAQIIEASKPVLEQHGLTVMQPMAGGDDGFIRVETIIVHTSGQHISSVASLPMPTTEGRGTLSQKVGSAVSYLRRYALAAMLGIAQADEDEQSRALGRPRGRATKDDHEVEEQIERRRIYRTVSDLSRTIWGNAMKERLPEYVEGFAKVNGFPRKSDEMSLDQLAELVTGLRELAEDTKMLADERPE